jgi:hypothetical protein
MEDLSEFERGVIVGARVAGTSVTKTAALLVVSRTTVSRHQGEFTFGEHQRKPTIRNV